MARADTIFALSSGAPPAAIGIVRISGPAAFEIGAKLAGDLPEPRRAGLRALRDPADSALLDRALVLCFPAPDTATGEDLVELHVHGGRAVVAAVEAAIAHDDRARQAEPGEFTRRALENGVIDLTAAEGLGDLLSAQTEGQRRAALTMAEGGVRAKVETWTDALIAIAASIEAQLDFSDEDDVAATGVADVRDAIVRLDRDVERLLAMPSVERLHHGITVVIAGPPNSGKSTLINRLAERDVAIVSPISGTTRDRIEAAVVRGGVAYIITDTAGLTDAPSDVVERTGVDRAKSAMDATDILVWLGDDKPAERDAILVHARWDLPERQTVPQDRSVALSAQTGVGIAELWEAIAARSAMLLPREDAVAINRRQRDLLQKGRDHLVLAYQASDLLVVAEEVRTALQKLDAITGRAGVENVLDAIFSRFCIGK